MKLQEIKDEYAVEQGFYDWADLYRNAGYYDELIFFTHENRVFELIQLEQQNLIAGNARVNFNHEEIYESITDEYGRVYFVEPSSILNGNNIIR